MHGEVGAQGEVGGIVVDGDSERVVIVGDGEEATGGEVEDVAPRVFGGVTKPIGSQLS